MAMPLKPRDKGCQGEGGVMYFALQSWRMIGLHTFIWKVLYKCDTIFLVANILPFMNLKDS